MCLVFLLKHLLFIVFCLSNVLIYVDIVMDSKNIFKCQYVYEVYTHISVVYTMLFVEYLTNCFYKYTFKHANLSG